MIDEAVNHPGTEEPETPEEAARRTASPRYRRRLRVKATGKEKGDWKRLLNYQWIVHNFPFFLFLSFLATVYIYNGHYADKTIRNISAVGHELDELNYEYKTLKSEVMFRSKQSELSKAVEPLGLKELVAPQVVLVDSAR